MSTIGNALRRVRPKRAKGAAEARRGDDIGHVAQAPPVDIAPNDPVLAYFQSASGAVDLDSLDLESPAVEALKEAGVKLVVPLVSQGELIGLLNLGPRLSEREYSGDDRKLLANLASQAAPALRVGQLVQEQQAEVRTRERLEQELRVAQLIQQQFLPKELPELEGWQVSAFYRPARAVGGDFYDFIDLPDGKVGIVAGDVTDKGVPAALVMASTRSILRSEAARHSSPGTVLQRANELLYPDIPAHMFVTCLYAVLDPKNGKLVFANAGHNLPYVRSEQEGVKELSARGMPLGLMPGMDYEEKEATLAPGEVMLLHSDGVAEAHDPSGEMFGFPRMHDLMTRCSRADEVIDVMMTELDRFSGPGHEQEDDITLVSIKRSDHADRDGESGTSDATSTEVGPEFVEEFSVPSSVGNEREVMDRVATVVQNAGVSATKLEQLKTAVSEAAMNAIEHGNEGRAEVPVDVKVVMSNGSIKVAITDHGGGDHEIPEVETPDIEAKLAGLQKPRGWGLFLIQNMVDEMNVTTDDEHHTVELVVHLKGEEDAGRVG